MTEPPNEAAVIETLVASIRDGLPVSVTPRMQGYLLGESHRDKIATGEFLLRGACARLGVPVVKVLRALFPGQIPATGPVGAEHVAAARAFARTIRLPEGERVALVLRETEAMRRERAPDLSPKHSEADVQKFLHARGTELGIRMVEPGKGSPTIMGFTIPS